VILCAALDGVSTSPVWPTSIHEPRAVPAARRALPQNISGLNRVVARAEAAQASRQRSARLLAAESELRRATQQLAHLDLIEALLQAEIDVRAAAGELAR
jgi:hypothetical protein